MDDVLREFLLESHENLVQLDLDLVALEREPGDRDTLARAFRNFHTLKGTAGFLGLLRLEGVAHSAENLLSRLRAGELRCEPAVATALLAAVDAVRQLLAALEATGAEGDSNVSGVVESLERLARRRTPAIPAPDDRTVAPPAGDPRTTEFPAFRPELVAPPSLVFEPPESLAGGVLDGTIRVDVGVLDKLMTLVGELVLARNQIVRFRAATEEAAFLETVQRLNALTTELQEGVMKTRMQPVGAVCGKFPRVVRDLAVACGKQARLETDGLETELDKTVAEAVRDPLTHLLRNAVDHGIEAPDLRAARGKPAEGRISLRAAHEGGKVVIRLSDDGGGIDPARVRDRAVRNRLLTPDQAERLSEREALDLIFLPGFSTAERVTHTSGRGVGMDVVRSNVEKIGGGVEVESAAGRGTTVTMRIPLTLAIIPALTVSCGGDRYAIPQASLLELVRLEGEQAARGVEDVHGAPVTRLRGRLLPLVFLDRELRVAPARKEGEFNIVVLQADDRPFGLVVDDIHEAQEIVVKPLHKMLKGVGVFSGATILGDGRVALILDVGGVALAANVVTGGRVRAAGPLSAVAGEARRQALVFAAPGGGRMAVALDEVARLEEFAPDELERSGGRVVAQYRGEILPLVPVGRALRRLDPRRPARRGQRKRSGPLPVVVHSGAGGRVGLVVGRILDVVDEPAPAGGAKPGVRFTAVVGGRVTEFLDVPALVRAEGAE